MHAPTSQQSAASPWGEAGVPADGRTARLLARTMFRDLKEYGIANDKILEVASELIGLVTDELKEPQRTER
ncbi:MAG: hypothetical protein KC933_25555 [Myxococcales bacterium]|nr:hypothetical protein [Myxococcales bacterium]MCB9649776.1 hypothetical protein [Deltaproteobacteria bacterium]